MGQPKNLTIPYILGRFVLEARNSEKPRERSLFNKQQWSIEITDGVFVGFDGYSFDESDNESLDDESYLVTIDLDSDNRVSFLASLSNCLSGEPIVDEEYVQSQYETDIADQLSSTSWSRDQLEALIEKRYIKISR